MAQTDTKRDSEQTREVVPSDDSFFGHERSDSPWWNESAWFGFMIPERKINAYFYMWHRPNMKLTAAGVALWDPYGTERHNCLYSHWYNFNPLPEGADMFEYELANGMKCELIEPLKKYHLTYDSETCQMDLMWEGVHPPQNLHFQSNKGFGNFGGFHYEQLGHVTGLVTVEGEEIPVDCHHVRDHSWGVRGPLKGQVGGGLEMGWASDSTAFCVTVARPEPMAPVDAESRDRPGYGHFIKDGELGTVVAGTRRVVERASDGRPLRFVIDLEDERGRELHAEGRLENCLKWDDLWFVHWGLVSWEIDGEKGWGETQDWFDITLIRPHQRDALKRNATSHEQ